LETLPQIRFKLASPEGLLVQVGQKIEVGDLVLLLSRLSCGERMSKNPKEQPIVAWISLGIAVFSLLFTVVQTSLMRSQTNAIWRATRSDFTLRLYETMFIVKPNADISKAIAEGMPILKEHDGFASRHELDNYLGYLELLHSLLQQGSLEEKTVCTAFRLYVIGAWENEEIQALIANARKTYSNAYQNIEKLANRMRNCR